MGTRLFTVDARLLRELGERLVGRPHIALAELIKNSFDADARHVELTFEGDRIAIADDGHGMTENDFTERWMRIGTTVKNDQKLSPALLRPLTGSKGVGRLAVQLLAERLDVHTVGLFDPLSLVDEAQPTLAPEVVAGISWPEALKHKELTQVDVEVDVKKPQSVFAAGSTHGTLIELTHLTNPWTAESFEWLAREIWALQPPFATPTDDKDRFTITLKTPFPSVQASFDDQMEALMDIASAKIVGKLLPLGEAAPSGSQKFGLPEREPPSDEDGKLQSGQIEASEDQTDEDPGEPEKRAVTRVLVIDVALSGAAREKFVVDIPDCQISAFDFEIRVFDLRHRQPRGIKVNVARRYLSHFGGIHIYDNGFRMPYYGPEQDWLRLELDHARRLSRSELLPEELQVRNAMQDLPSNKRVFGAVNVSTSLEQAAADGAGRQPGDALSIQITRDRLRDSLALDQLTRSTRLALDLYALTRAKNKARGQVRRRGGLRPDNSDTIRSASDVVDTLRDTLPSSDYQTLKDSLASVADEVTAQRKEAKAYASLLGALATAGMTSLAYEHEVSKQRRGIEAVARKLGVLARNTPEDLRETLLEQAASLFRWTERSDRISELFSPLTHEESRTGIQSYRAASVVDQVVETMSVIGRGTTVDSDNLPTELMLPPGSFAAWSAIFQNLLTNAFRATAEIHPGRVTIDGGTGSRKGWIRFQDNGSGINLEIAEELFLPFERAAESSEKAEALGLGGSGLGLTIVRMITDELRCVVAFETPDLGWATAATITWKV